MSASIIIAALASTLVPDLQAILDERRERQDIPGVSVFVTHGDELVYSGGSGVADLETSRVITANTRMYAGSLSKVFTGVLALTAVENGSMHLDDTVPSRLLPISGGKSGITYADLMTHASGLPREGDFGYWFSADFPDRNALLEYLASAKVRELPGVDFHYSNIGYAVLGLAAADTFGATYAEALRNEVLRPLAMNSSGAPGPADGVSRGYTPTGRIIPNETRPFAGVGRKIGDRNLREYHDARAMSPAFGIYTTANDLSRLAQFLLGYGPDGVLSMRSRQNMLAAQPSGWGLGIKIDRFRDRPVASHTGWFAAHRSHLILDLDAKIAVGVLANSDSGKPGIIAEALLARMLDEISVVNADQSR